MSIPLSLNPILGPSSPIVSALAETIPYSVVANTGIPIIGWIRLSFNKKSITFSEAFYIIPAKAFLIRNNLLTISILTSILSTSVGFYFPLKIYCYKDTVQKTFTVASRSQVIQLLSSTTSYLKTQLFYYLQHDQIPSTIKTCIIKKILPHIPAIEQSLKTTFLNLHTLSKINTQHALTPPSLITLSTLTVLKIPTSQSNNHSSNLLTMSNLSSSIIKMLSPFLRSIFQKNQMAQIAYDYLELQITSKESSDIYELALKATPGYLSCLNLLSYTKKRFHTAAITVILQKQFLEHALTIFSINSCFSICCKNALKTKLLGYNLLQAYEKLAIIARSFTLSYPFLSKKDNHLINILWNGFSNMLTPLSLPIPSSIETVQLNSTSYLMDQIAEDLLLLSFTLFFYLENPSFLKKEEVLKQLQQVEKFTCRSVNYLQKISLISHSPWMQDFLLELTNTLKSAKNALEEKASTLDAPLHLIQMSYLDDYIYKKALSTEYLSDAIPAPITHSCLKSSSVHPSHPLSTASNLPFITEPKNQSSYSKGKDSYRVNFSL
ncbi:hypothetical protein CLAVI_000119 [Candidatus Clavichlamydia salmonicola]|uniref:hypothetical protein n=1 Tax=Candidatus Clavichlamydia salmonicola TaxID=469812 RepID=UPI001891C104|nr:hypothetical protein [Candidatus Clavichlamydia salmonicola]MBF5050513.1 hypothetical protein [Candidatus Clavichlamydia salmonicola]